MISQCPPTLEHIENKEIEEEKVNRERARLQQYLDAVGYLPKRQKSVLLLRSKNYKYKEIATELGISLDDVKFNLHIARKNLKKIVQKNAIQNTSKL
jgi:DNA-directed RNA polymerase specialized sigma24 family protein